MNSLTFCDFHSISYLTGIPEEQAAERRSHSEVQAEKSRDFPPAETED